MIAAVATVWMLLKPAGDAVNDRLSSDAPLTSDGTGDGDLVVGDDVENDTSGDEQTEDTGSPSSDAETSSSSSSSTSTTTTTVAAFVNGQRGIGFDPLGDNDEHNEAAGRAIDGDPTSFWYTQSYTTRAFGGIKGGVGLILEFEEPQEVSVLNVRASREGWSARIYEADDVAATLEAWGEPIAEFSDIGQQAELDVPDISVTAVLLWVTDLGLAPDQTPEDYDAQVAAAETVQRLEIFEVDLVG